MNTASLGNQNPGGDGGLPPQAEVEVSRPGMRERSTRTPQVNRNISAILILLAFLAGFGISHILQPPRMKRKFYGQIIFSATATDTNAALVARLQNRLESGGFEKFVADTPGPNAERLQLVLEGMLPITVWASNLQTYFNKDGDVASFTWGRIDGKDQNYLELQMFPAGVKSGYDDTLEGVPLALKLREDLLKELSKTEGGANGSPRSETNQASPAPETRR
jgi:hypothetical protein